MLLAVARGSLCLGQCLRPVLPRASSVLHTASLHTPAGQDSQREPLKHWALHVSPFTCVRAQLTSSSISVTPLDPHAFPAADRAFVTVREVSEGQETASDHCHVRYDEESRELRITDTGHSKDLMIHLEAPIKSNVFISAEGRGHVHISKMECDICKVHTQTGHCTLHSVKSHQVAVRSAGGHVTGLGTIHGNVHIATSGDSAVDVKKLQGTTMNVSTERGYVKVKAIYAESSSVSSCSGRVLLGNVHGSATVTTESGDTVIDGSNSFLKVSSLSGNIDVYVGDGGSADIVSEQGAVSVRVPSSVRAGVELCGSSVDISPEVVFHQEERQQAPGQTTVTGFVNEDSAPHLPHVRAHTSGPVRLKTQSWFESLKLKS